MDRGGDGEALGPTDPAERLLIERQIETVRWLRTSLGLSQAALATRLRVSLSTVSKWEQGRATMRRRIRLRAALVLGPLLDTPQGEV